MLNYRLANGEYDGKSGPGHKQIPPTKPNPPTKQRIAILGGGIAALTTAFQLTSAPDAAEKYDITMYQMGWRLGGKCALPVAPMTASKNTAFMDFWAVITTPCQ